MAKLPIKRGSHRGIGRIYGFRAVDSLASRVVGANRKTRLPGPEELREKADGTRIPRKKQALLLEAERAEKNRLAAEKRMIGPKAEECARRALEAAKWDRENPKG